ncbi:DNA polymerase III subunit gamma/tau [Roseofilum capinflatum]|uniref:DNA polymerase III subunit gamma/tau n=1 Tax=Roseofilum capinflatum BLCC-M114 TaxID=3022440 RepID=A0ABT7B6B2_9CYAN|nr:DNA polymerase III subunit gamma/tau [Roseofilum capinflatum]MDJ1174705.1 DNA polymerase III subunit gamma/tau [Roseofilum capinflatum BLCC-M114]
MQLALKYRPKTFDELKGNDFTKVTLKRQIERKRIARTYLFSGSKGTGKTTVARIFAKALNCEASDTALRPCGECDSCKSFERGAALAYQEIDCAANSGVDSARELVVASAYTPLSGQYNVYVLDECHMLTTAAQNSLLKTFEEGGDRCVFILATTEPGRLLDTVVSRARHFQFAPPARNESIEYIRELSKAEGIEIDSDAISALLKEKKGLRDALQLLDLLASRGDRITSALVSEALAGVRSDDIKALVSLIERKDLGEAGGKFRVLCAAGHSPAKVLESLSNEYLGRVRMMEPAYLSHIKTITKALGSIRFLSESQAESWGEAVVYELCGVSANGSPVSPIVSPISPNVSPVSLAVSPAVSPVSPISPGSQPVSPVSPVSPIVSPVSHTNGAKTAIAVKTKLKREQIMAMKLAIQDMNPALQEALKGSQPIEIDANGALHIRTEKSISKRHLSQAAKAFGVTEVIVDA